MDTLPPLLDWVLGTTFRASLLTLVVLLMQAALRRHLSARWRYALWLPVLLVLLMPVFPQSEWSVSTILRQNTQQLPTTFLIDPVDMDVPTLAAATGTPVAAPALSMQSLLLWLWCSGAIATLLLGSVSFLQVLRRFRHERLPVPDFLQRELAHAAVSVRLHRVPHVWLSTSVTSPAVAGLLRPVLLLPATFTGTLSPQERSLVLKHELLHIKRGDLWVNTLLCVLLALHWFNPLLWFAFFRARLDRETACDAQVLSGQDSAHRTLYGHTLLKAGTTFAPHRLGLGFAGLFQRGTALRTRIYSIASQPRPHPLVKAILVVAMLCLAFLGVTSAAPPASKKGPQVRIITRFIELPANAKLPPQLDGTDTAPAPVVILNDPDYQLALRKLSQMKGVDLMSAPQMITRARQPARVEVTQKMPYKNASGKPATQDCGVTITALPKVVKRDHLELDVSSTFVEVAGFVKRKGGGEQPVFTEAKTKASVSITPGQTVFLELEPKGQKQVVMEENGSGKITSRKTVYHMRRRLAFFTASLAEPSSGK